MRSFPTVLSIAMVVGMLGMPGLVSGSTPDPGVAPSASPAPTMRRAMCPSIHGGSCLGALPAGTYTTSVFQTPISYTVPEGWANYEDLPGNFLLIPPGGSNDGVDAGTSDYVGIYQNVAVAAEDCESRPEPGVGHTAAEMAAALAARGGLVVTEPTPVEVGGLSGTMIDIAIDPGAGVGCNIPELSSLLVPLFIGRGPADVEHGQFDWFTTRLYLLDHGDTNLVIEISDVATSPGTVVDYEPVIAALGFGPE